MFEFQGAGSSYGKKCFKRVTVDATVDKGAGYDENDSFIDNTEAVLIIITYVYFSLQSNENNFSV